MGMWSLCCVLRHKQEALADYTVYIEPIIFAARNSQLSQSINLTGRHVEVTDALKDYVNSKFSKLERHFDQINNVHVILDVEKLIQKAEATLHVNGGELFATSEHSDMYAAIDGLIDKLDRQVIKHKEKLKNHN